MFDVIDEIFQDDSATASVSRKDEHGKTRTAKLNVSPVGDEHADYVKSAEVSGATCSKTWKKGETKYAKSVKASGAKAGKFVAALEDMAEGEGAGVDTHKPETKKEKAAREKAEKEEKAAREALGATA